MRNTSGQSYRSLSEEKDQWDDEQWVSAFTQDTMLLKRPLFVKDGIAVAVGFRDPDAVRQAIFGVADLEDEEISPSTGKSFYSSSAHTVNQQRPILNESSCGFSVDVNRARS